MLSTRTQHWKRERDPEDLINIKNMRETKKALVTYWFKGDCVRLYIQLLDEGVVDPHG